MVTSAASGRFEFRVRPELKQRIEYAAALVHETASDFARTAVEDRVATVVREHSLVTPVSADFFDALLAALDEPPRSNEALVRAAARLDDVVVRR
jgi:uncharacterized protein (DUF1778 family)